MRGRPTADLTTEQKDLRKLLGSEKLRSARLVEEMQGIEKKYEEALHPHQIPPEGVPDWNELERIKKQIDMDQIGDKPEKK